MTRKLVTLALGASLALLATPSDVFAGRGGGRGGGYGGGGGGGYNRGGSMGGYNRGGSMGGSPSFSQPRSSANGNRSQGGGEYGNRSQSGYGSNAGYGNRSQSPSNAGAAAAGAGYSNRNQGPSNAGAAAAGAGYSNRNQGPSNAGAAAAGAGYSNRNQGPSNAGAAAAAAGYANRNQNPYSNAGAAAAGAGYANRNQNPYSNAGAAAAGAGYANRNQYDQYHPGMTNGTWNGNYGAWGVGGVCAAGVGAWGVGSPMYGYGYSGYSNPYATGMGVAAAGQPVDQTQPAGGPAAAPAYDYSQPLNTAATAPEPSATDQSGSVFDQARAAFRSNDYANALQLTQQAIGQAPNDATMHEFQALVSFAQGKYDQAAGPLYAVLSVGPGWDWTSLIGNYSDANIYTEQIRNLEAFVKGNRTSAPARFVLAYHYVTQGHKDAAAAQLKEVVALQPNDTLSAQLLGKLQPASTAGEAPSAPAQTPPVEVGKLTGDWTASAPQNSKVTLSIKDDGGFTWTVAVPGKPPTAISGKSTLADGTLTLAGDQASRMGALTGQVARQDDTHFSFRVTGAPASDPGLAFAR